MNLGTPTAVAQRTHLWRHVLVALLLSGFPCWESAAAADVAPEDVVQLSGTGSSLLCHLIHAWSAVYIATGVNITYTCTGSGTGKRNVVSGESDFAASDSLFSNAQLAAAPDLQVVPVVIAPVALVFNLEGISTVTLDVPTAADIFTGRIEFWDDSRITRLSPGNFNLPHIRIAVVVRADSSGTTEILTRGLRGYGVWSHAPGPVFPAGIISAARNGSFRACLKSSGVLDCVAEVPGSISYNGIAGVLQRGVHFVVIANSAGKVTMPGWEDGRSSAKEALVDSDTLVGEVPGMTGYPLSGISYVAVRRGSPKACKVLQLFRWLLASGEAAKHTSKINLVHVSPATISKALAVIHNPSCGILPEPVALQCPACGDADLAMFHTLGYGFSQEKEGRFLDIRGLSDAPAFLTALRGDHLEAWSSDPRYSVFPVGIALNIMACNFGIVGVSADWNIDVSLIRDMVSRNVASWSDVRFRTSPSYTPFFSSNITIVVDRSLRGYSEFVKQLGLDPARHPPHVILQSNNEVMQYLKATPGAVSFVDYSSGKTWGLSVANPVIADVATAPSLADLTATEPEILKYDRTLQRFSLGAGGAYPFHLPIFVAVQREVLGDCYGNRHAELLQWMLSPSAQSLWQGMYVHPLVSSEVRAALTLQLATLQCNGAVIAPVPEGPSGDDATTIIIASACAGGVVVICAVAAALFMRRLQAAKLEKLYGAATVAAEMAEAIAVLDFDGLVKLHNVKNPDRVQLAMRNILVMMSEFIRHVPQHVVKAARGQCPDESSDDEHPPNGTGSSGASLRIFVHPRAAKAHSPPATPHAGPKGAPGGEATAEQHTAPRNALGFKKAILSKDRQVRKVIALVLRKRLAEDGCCDEERQTLLAEVGAAADQLRGVTHCVSEDRIILVWGVLGSLAGSANVNATRCATRLAQEGVSCGVHVSPSACLYLGTAAVQTFHVLGGVVEDADTLSRVAEAASIPSVVSRDLSYGSWTGRFVASRFPAVASACGGCDKPLRTMAVFGAIGEAVRGREWMYEAQSDDTAWVTAVDTAMSLVLEQRDPPGARAVLQSANRNSSVAWVMSFIDAAEASGKPCLFIEVTAAGTTLTSTSRCISTRPRGTTLGYSQLSFAAPLSGSVEEEDPDRGLYKGNNAPSTPLSVSEVC